MLDLKRLDGLREALLRDDDLAEVMRRFLDDFAEDPEFLGRGFDAEEPGLVRLVEDVLFHAFGSRPPPLELRLRRLAPTPFLHGALMVGQKPATILWFEDVGVGLLSLLTDPQRGVCHHIRFRAVAAATPEAGSRGL